MGRAVACALFGWAVLLLLSLLMPGWGQQAAPAPGEGVKEAAPGADAAAEAAPPPIRIIPQDGFNLQIVDQIDPHYLVVSVNPPIHNWFAGQFTDLPTDKEVTIGMCLEGCDSPGAKADVSKWVGLRPVMTYADPTKYESYEWFQKDEQGRWVSGDPFKQGDARYAGTGKVPTQSAIPAELSEQFLVEDGKGGAYWQPWRDVDYAEALPNVNIFRMKQKFALPTAAVAMRLQYNYTYLSNFVNSLQGKPNVEVQSVGKSAEGRDLWVVKVAEASDMAEKDRPVVLVYCREHATEPDGSWVIEGMIRWLLSDDAGGRECRRKITWLFIPILDPDGTWASRYATICWEFWPHRDTPVEVMFFTRWLGRLTMADGGRLDVVLSTHNVESSEAPNVLLYIGDERKPLETRLFHQMLLELLDGRTFQDGIQKYDVCANRLLGWAGGRFGALSLLYEVNSRAPNAHLTIRDLEDLGIRFGTAVRAYLESPQGREAATASRAFLESRREAMRQYYQNRDAQMPPTMDEMLLMAF